ncbi:hypothetical protein CMQ_6122 [Grosmannia clavigera kw1407]|uniref:Uncharacterized protein n=1 Tax=Grosmannia clavigera (strain kw1407 / UAMH 11150) TaxID=655863 RepID=F0XLR5_GROCL|nr:uncharacterized protein CMQ_6122 [Grosmannia clavigera kw1407]EFX01180.1 hypothetical protein CMQ_6122 [Grosmannia clavigera kw1407]
MAALPLQYPDLAIYLADETNIPIISSAGLGLYGEREEGDDDDDNSDSGSGAATPADTRQRPSRRQRAEALDDLTTTAFRARDAAARLGLGLDCLDPEPGMPSLTDDAMAAWGMTPPEHVVVTYESGAVLIESFLDPLQQQRLQRMQRQQQLQQMRQLQQLQVQQPHRTLRADLALRSTPSPTERLSESGSPFYSPQGPIDIHDYADDDDDDENGGGPLLVGLVLAPGEQSLRDARRATGRLQRIGHAVQQDWAAQGSG